MGVLKTNWRMWLEVSLHLLYWLFYFASVNVDWGADWMDKSIRPGLAQMTIALNPVFFYLNSLWLIPSFLKSKNWYNYFIYTGVLVFGVELIRSLIFALKSPAEDTFQGAFIAELFGGDNLIWGFPNSLFFTFILSFAYRFTRDWIVHQRRITFLTAQAKAMQEDLDSLKESQRMEDDTPVQEVIEDLKKVISQDEKAYRSSFQSKKPDGTFILRVKDIAHIKAQGDFTIAIDLKEGRHILNHSLSTIEQLLDPAQFFRINRSEIVNGNQIKKFVGHSKNRLEIHLRHSNTILYTSTGRTPEFRIWVDNL
ncbi:MAG: LytTR family DNA-binding domain-containing protein [Bacteroidota bacterium]